MEVLVDLLISVTCMTVMDRQWVLGILAGVLILMRCLPQCPATTLTTMVLHEETRSWADARQVCSQDGGKLLSIQDPEKFSDLLYMDSLPSWNSRVMTAELWFGLHTEVGASCDTVQYQWDDGEPLGSWSDWYVGSYTEPNACTSDLCIRISSSKWKTISCSSQYGFICEFRGGTCGFEAVTDKAFTRDSDILDIQNVLVKMESTNNLATCLEACQTSTTMGDLDCWFVVTNSSNSDICYLYYTSDKYLADKVENTTVTPGSTIHIKRCGSVAVYGETTTTTTTTTSATTTTTCVSLATTTMSAATITTTQATTTTTILPTTNGVQCLRYSNQTITYTANELQVQLQKLKTELTVIKNSTNRHLRTLISVYDGRSSAVNIGVIGTIFLGIIPVLFFIADIPMLYRHIRGRWDEDEDDDYVID